MVKYDAIPPTHCHVEYYYGVTMLCSWSVCVGGTGEDLALVRDLPVPITA